MEDNKLKEEEFFDETLEVSTEEEGSAEEAEPQKLDDSELEEISGGASRKRDIYYCYYCARRHTLMRQYPWRIRPAGYKKWYNNACRYDCEKNGPFFTLPLVSGRTAYFNAQVQRLG